MAQQVNASRAKAWREILSDDELQLTEAILGHVLKAHNYPGLRFGLDHPVEVYLFRMLRRYPEVIGEVLARGVRFWKAPGEDWHLGLILGYPSE